MDKHIYLVIMAGGTGSRFWPLSRADRPKQFLDILGVGKTFLQQTYERFLPLVAPENILVVTNSQYVELVRQQLPELSKEQILAEPMGRNTAPCIAYAAFRLRAADPDAVMIVTPADHLITNEKEFERSVLGSVKFASTHDAMMTIGIQPTSPHTGYGYIQYEGESASSGAGVICKVRTFTEKPGTKMAQTFIDSGEFLWNSGIFVWRAQTVLSALREHLNEVYSLFEPLAGKFGTPGERDAVRRIYSEAHNISIDFGVLEKASNVYVRSSTFGWSDIGTWNSLYAQLPVDEKFNYAGARAMLSNTRGTLVDVPDGKLAVVDGLDDYLVIDTSDVLLVWPRSREQEIKQIVTSLRFDGGEEFL